MKIDILSAPTDNPAQLDTLVNRPGHFVEEWIEGHPVKPLAEASPDSVRAHRRWLPWRDHNE